MSSNNATTLSAALEKRGLPSGWHAKILDAMAECGMLSSQMHAVSSQDALMAAKTEANLRGLEQIHARCAMDLARLQVPMPKPGTKLDPWAISAACKSAGWSTQRAMELKASLAAINLL
jgi:hypothetical protein